MNLQKIHYQRFALFLLNRIKSIQNLTQISYQYHPSALLPCLTPNNNTQPPPSPPLLPPSPPRPALFTSPEIL